MKRAHLYARAVGGEWVRAGIVSTTAGEQRAVTTLPLPVGSLLAVRAESRGLVYLERQGGELVLIHERDGRREEGRRRSEVDASGLRNPAKLDEAFAALATAAVELGADIAEEWLRGGA